jgi:plastocyanin
LLRRCFPERGPAVPAAQRSPTGALQGYVQINAIMAAPQLAMTGTAAHAHAPEAYRHAVVYFDTAPAGSEPPPEGRVVMRQRGTAFAPHVLAITVGTTVEFPNDDDTYHNVFAETRRFDWRYAAGRSRLSLDRRHRARLLRHPLADERVHPGLRSPVPRRHRPRGRH